MADEILLTSGTNEVEILEFYLEGQSYGLNVAKVLQLIEYDESKLTPMPDSLPSLGVFLWRDKTFELINLKIALNRSVNKKIKLARPIVLITKFNDIINGFLIDSINQIHRVSWEDISPVSQYIETYSTPLIGTMHLDNREILLIDFEHIISVLFPETRVDSKINIESITHKIERKNAKIIFAEDSRLIRKSVVKILGDVGYKNIVSFENGSDALDYIKTIYKKIEGNINKLGEYINLIITDIEMPKMDGLTLCKKIKKELKIACPVIIFSSLIDNQMGLKCKEVGANAFTTKPKAGELVKIVDSILGI